MNADHRAKISAALTGTKRSPETRARMSAAQKGRIITPEHAGRIAAALRGKTIPAEVRAKISAAHLGRAKSAETRARMSGPRRGEEIGYSAAHWRATRELPRICETTDDTCRGRLDVAFRHDAPSDLVKIDANFGIPYYAGHWRDGYLRLCRSHHVRYDKH